MSQTYESLCENLKTSPKTWLVTGVGGFIGSNLLETLLDLKQRVVGIDNFSTGHRHNLDDVQSRVGQTCWSNFRLIVGDITDANVCADSCNGVDYVLHQAALGSVPRSIKDPLKTHRSNIDGFLAILLAARDANVTRFVYASSSSVYGDEPKLPKKEELIGKPLSPYAATKRVNELYASTFSEVYGIETIGLRYFNVFGARQDKNGAYAAVIPRWIGEIISGDTVTIFGDGETSRDFCYVDNAVQANLLATCAQTPEAINKVYNVAVGERTTLNELYDALSKSCAEKIQVKPNAKPNYEPFRSGDVRHSLADIGQAKRILGYNPTHTFHSGLEETVSWFVNKYSA